MKRITALTFLTAIFISIGSVCAHAQSVMFEVPFDFTVQNYVLPAGTYRVSKTSEHVLQIRSRDGRFSALSSTFAADDSRSSGIGKLIFAKYGKQYFLHEAHCSGLSMNAAIPISKLEKRARIEVAQLPSSQTTVAALRTGEK